MTDRTPNDVTVVTGVIGVDAHVTGNWLLQYALKEAGFKVVWLGVCVSQEELINAAIESAADAILVSSLYGHALLDCEGLRQKCVEKGLDSILLYVGGNLVVGKHDWPPVERQFRGLGFDRAYPPGTLPETAIVDLYTDLNLTRPRAIEAASATGGT